MSERQIVNYNGARAMERRPSSPLLDQYGRDIQSGSVTISGDTRPMNGGSGFMRWFLSGLSTDAEIYRKLPLARAKCRALDNGEEPNDYVRKFLAELENNVIGSEGVVLQMLVKEENDRVVYGKELKFLKDFQRKRNRLRMKVYEFLKSRGFRVQKPRAYRAYRMKQGRAMVLAGDPDLYANKLIEDAWAEWKQKENCTVTRQVTFHSVERLELRGAARDGEAIVRKVKGFKNAFGFALQLIDPDWLDIRFNGQAENGNQVVMGIEFDEWRSPVAFHIITQDPKQWLWGANAGYQSTNPGVNRQRIDAKEICHIGVRERVDQTRMVPWLLSCINRLKMLGKYEEAELLAAIASACKGGVYENPLDPTDDGPPPGVEVTSQGEFVERLSPGMVTVAKYGWRYTPINPTHPNGDYGNFRKGVLRGVAAGLPGSTYYGISQDLEAVNFSAMQGGDREARESYMMLQNWFIGDMHTPIFPDWLEAALMSGKVALPLSKIQKFNKPSWHGRRWRAIDPIKDVTAKALSVAKGFTSRQRVIAETTGDDYEDIMLELAYEKEFEESLGLDFSDAAEAGTLPPDNGDNEDKQPANDDDEDPVVKQAVAAMLKSVFGGKKKKKAKAVPVAGKIE